MAARALTARHFALFAIGALLASLLVAAVTPPAHAAFGFKSKFGTNGGAGALGLGDGEFINPYAVAIGPSNNIYVLEYKDCSVRILNSSGGFIRRFGGPCDNPFSPSSAGMYQPVAIDVAMNGDVYIADQYFARVQVYDGFGTYLRSIGNTGPVGNRLSGPNGLTVTPLTATPDVYVSDSISQRIAKYDSSGNFQWTRGEDVLATDADTGSELCNVAADCKTGVTGSGNGEFWQPMSVDFDAASGSLWVAERGNERVQKVSASDGAYQSAFAAPFATSAEYDATSGKVWVSNGIEHHVNRYDAAGVSDRQLGTGSATNADGDISFPGASAVTATSGLIVPDFNLHRIQAFNEAGGFVFKAGKNGGPGEQSGSANGEFNRPNDAVETGGKIWVTDGGNNRLERFSSAGAWELTIPATTGSTTQGGKFNYPNGITVDSSGNIWVADMLNNRIEKFDSSGGFLLAFGYDVLSGAPSSAGEICSAALSCKAGISGTADSQFAAPIDIAFSPTGDLYVVEQNNHRVQRFNPTTLAHLATIGGPSPSTFGSPRSIAFDSSGNYYVADYNSNRVRKFNSSDVFQQNIALDSVNGTNGNPTGVAVLGNGEIQIVEGPLNRVKVFAADGTTVVRSYGEIGSNDGQFFQPSQVSAGAATDEVLVADSGNHRIQRFGTATLATPSISITQPVDLTSTHETNTMLTYTAVDRTGGTPTCYPGSGTLYPLVEGPNNIVVQCSDPFGPAFTANVHVTRIIDTTPPDIVITAPVDGSVTAVATANLAYTASDDSGETPTCDKTNGATVPLTAGPNTITVSCHDAYGNTGNASTTVNYVPPVTPTPPVTPPVKPAAPVIGLNRLKPFKFKGKIAVTVTCDKACDLVLTAVVTIGAKKYVGTATAAGISAGVVAGRITFSKKKTKAIIKALKAGKKLKTSLTVSGKGAGGAAAPVIASVKLKK